MGYSMKKFFSDLLERLTGRSRIAILESENVRLTRKILEVSGYPPEAIDKLESAISPEKIKELALKGKPRRAGRSITWAQYGRQMEARSETQRRAVVEALVGSQEAQRVERILVGPTKEQDGGK
jgi:hypothetical protein